MAYFVILFLVFVIFLLLIQRSKFKNKINELDNTINTLIYNPEKFITNNTNNNDVEVHHANKLTPNSHESNENKSDENNQPLNKITEFEPYFLPDWVYSDGIREVRGYVKIKYSSGYGETERELSLRYYHPQSNKIFAFCFLRGDFRTFNRANIEEISINGVSLSKRKFLSWINDNSFEAKGLPLKPEIMNSDSSINVDCRLSIVCSKEKYLHKQRELSAIIYNHQSKMSGEIFGLCMKTNEYRLIPLCDIVQCFDDNGVDITSKIRSYLRTHKK